MAIKRRERPFCPYKITRHNMSFSLLIKPFPDILNPFILRVLRVRRILRILRILRVATDAAGTPNRLQPSIHGWGPDRWRTWSRAWSRAWSPAWSWTWSTVHLDVASLLFLKLLCLAETSPAAKLCEFVSQCSSVSPTSLTPLMILCSVYILQPL